MHHNMLIDGCTRSGQGGVSACLEAVKQLPPDPCVYAALRREGGIIFDRQQQCWLVTGHEQIRRILLSGHAVASTPPEESAGISHVPLIQDVLSLLSRQILLKDEEAHERLARLMRQPLQRQIHQLRTPICEQIEALLAAVSRRERFDVVSEFAEPLAYWVMARLVGVSSQPQEQLREWGSALADVTSGRLMRARTLRSVLEMQEACLQLVRQRQASPREDVISAFAAETGWESDLELADNAMTIFGAGVTTITKAIVHSVLFLSECRERSRVDGEFTEQLLCRVTPTRYITRWARVPLTIDGQRIEAGQQVYLLLEAGNLELAGSAAPVWKQHLAFGVTSNPHYCIGAALPRYVLQEALTRLLLRFPDLRILERGPWGKNANLSGITTVIVTKGE